MKRTAVVIFLLAVAIGSSAFAVEATGTYADAKAAAIQNDKPLLVDFSTSW